VVREMNFMNKIIPISLVYSGAVIEPIFAKEEKPSIIVAGVAIARTPAFRSNYPKHHVKYREAISWLHLKRF
jgi:hypothetical protein